MSFKKTTNTTIKNGLHKIWLRSRERSKALKDGNYTCNRCGAKASVAKGREQKVEVHHTCPIPWEEVIEFVRNSILHNPDKLEVLCKECHKKETLKDG